MKLKIKIVGIIFLIISITLITLIFHKNNNVKNIVKIKKKTEKRVIPTTPFLNKPISKRELFKYSSSFIYYLGEARPGIISRYDVALLNPKMWYKNSLNKLNDSKTISLAECSFTKVDGGTKLYSVIPNTLKKRAIGPKPTLIMNIEDSWLQLLKEYRISQLIKSGFDGIVIEDINLIGESDNNITDLRLFLGELKLDYPKLLILFKGNLESALKLKPFLDGYIMLGFNHGVERKIDLVEDLKLSQFSKILTVDMVDPQLTEKVTKFYKRSLDNGFLPFIGKNLTMLVSTPKLPPDSGTGFFRIMNIKPNSIIKFDNKVVTPDEGKNYIFLKKIKKGIYKLNINKIIHDVYVTPGRTSIYFFQ